MPTPRCPRAPAPAIGAGLRHVCDDVPGIRRLRCGRGFRYIDADGRRVQDAATLGRIRRLAIPPAYLDVWICPRADGHLQATGRDARGRKQYRYHAQWRDLRDADKFERITAFAAALPALRRAVRRDVALPGWPRDKVVAALLWAMSLTLVRVGNEAYVRENGSFGLTTLRNRHARFGREGLLLRYPAKSGKVQEVSIDDPRLVRMMRRLHQLPGQALFQYRGADGMPQSVDSGMVNDYLRTHMGADFTAKDFRTWGATVAAFRLLAATPRPEPASERALAAAENAVVASVAAVLGNTVSVCRKSYIDPCVLAGWREGRLCVDGSCRTPRQWEQAARRHLVRAHRAARRPTAA